MSAELYIMSISGIVLTTYLAISGGFAESFSISEEGIKLSWPFKKSRFYKWNEFVSSGTVVADLGNGQTLVWMYFSKELLNIKELRHFGDKTRHDYDSVCSIVPTKKNLSKILEFVPYRLRDGLDNVFTYGLSHRLNR